MNMEEDPEYEALDDEQKNVLKHMAKLRVAQENNGVSQIRKGEEAIQDASHTLRHGDDDTLTASSKYQEAKSALAMGDDARAINLAGEALLLQGGRGCPIIMNQHTGEVEPELSAAAKRLLQNGDGAARANAHALLSMVRMQSQDLHGAVTHISHAIKLRPKHPGQFFHRSALYAMCRQPGKSLSDLREAQKVAGPNLHREMTYRRSAAKLLLNALPGREAEGIQELGSLIDEIEQIEDAHISVKKDHACDLYMMAANGRCVNDEERAEFFRRAEAVFAELPHELAKECDEFRLTAQLFQKGFMPSKKDKKKSDCVFKKNDCVELSGLSNQAYNGQRAVIQEVMSKKKRCLVKLPASHNHKTISVKISNVRKLDHLGSNNAEDEGADLMSEEAISEQLQDRGRFAKGDRVRIAGLTAAQYNGKAGVVRSDLFTLQDSSARYKIYVPELKKTINLKPANLKAGTPSERVCAICLDDELTAPVKLGCMHVFCADCINNVVAKGEGESKELCPCCRAPLMAKDYGFIAGIMARVKPGASRGAYEELAQAAVGHPMLGRVKSGVIATAEDLREDGLSQMSAFEDGYKEATLHAGQMDQQERQRQIIRSCTDMAMNDADEYGDGDQRFVQAIAGGDPGYPLRHLWCSGGGRGDNPFACPWYFSPFQLACAFGCRDEVAAVLSSHPSDKESMTKLLEKRESILRKSPLLQCINGARFMRCDERPQQLARLPEKYAHLRSGTPDHLGVARLLIDAGANVNARDIAGFSCAHHCVTSVASEQSLEIAPLLAQAGANFNAANRFGEVALLAVIMNMKFLDQVRVARLLVDQCGADADIVCKCGGPMEMSPRSMAQRTSVMDGGRMLAALGGKQRKGKSQPTKQRARHHGGASNTSTPNAGGGAGGGSASTKKKVLYAADGSVLASPKCASCLVEDGQFHCARCRLVSYCSRECQRRHWKPSHKKDCSPR
jgi:hypothetical protein